MGEHVYRQKKCHWAFFISYFMAKRFHFVILHCSALCCSGGEMIFFSFNFFLEICGFPAFTESPEIHGNIDYAVVKHCV